MKRSTLAHPRNELAPRRPELLAADTASTAAVESSSSSGGSKLLSNPVLRKAAIRAIGGGFSGWIAGVIQVCCLMWLRTTMNYQYRHGTSTMAALRTLYGQGGIARFYRGMGWALLQTPLSRFGDAAANSGVRELLATTSLPMGLQTACAGLAASMWRVAITPLDTLKTTLQVEGADAYALLVKKVADHGAGVLYSGASATMLASFIGNYPWWFTFNYLDRFLPVVPEGVLAMKLCRGAVLGVSATCVSDTVSNSLRVIKTTRQTSSEALSYVQAAQLVISKDGWAGLLMRGLGTRLITNCIQASLFTIVWKLIEERIAQSELKVKAEAVREAAPGPVDADSSTAAAGVEEAQASVSDETPATDEDGDSGGCSTTPQ